MRYFFEYYDSFDDNGDYVHRIVTYFKQGEHYAYVFTPDTAFACMTKIFSHAMDKDLNLTVKEAEAISIVMEELIDDEDFIGGL